MTVDTSWRISTSGLMQSAIRSLRLLFAILVRSCLGVSISRLQLPTDIFDRIASRRFPNADVILRGLACSIWPMTQHGNATVADGFVFTERVLKSAEQAATSCCDHDREVSETDSGCRSFSTPNHRQCTASNLGQRRQTLHSKS